MSLSLLMTPFVIPWSSMPFAVEIAPLSEPFGLPRVAAAYIQPQKLYRKLKLNSTIYTLLNFSDKYQIMSGEWQGNSVVFVSFRFIYTLSTIVLMCCIRAKFYRLLCSYHLTRNKCKCTWGF